MAAAAILDFWNFEFLTVGRVEWVKLRHHAKFIGDRSNWCCWEMAIFPFYQDGGHLPSWIWIYDASLDHRAFGGLCLWLYKIWLQLTQYCSNFDNKQILILRNLGLKMPIHAPKIGVFGSKIGEGVMLCWPPMNLFLRAFGGCYLCATFVENRWRNATVRVHTDRHTHYITQWQR